MSWRDTKFYKKRQKSAEVKEQKVLELLKEMPKNKEGFAIVKISFLADKLNIAYSSLRETLIRLYKKGFIEISESFKYVSSKHEKAIKVLK